jgi:ribonuclease R
VIGVTLTENNSATLQQRILDFVYHPNYRPVKAKGILVGLELPTEDYPAVRMAVKRLVASGQLAYAANHLVISPQMMAGEPKLIRGTFRQAAAGFGFVRPLPSGLLGPTEDIFIPAPMTGSAMEGDQVNVRVRASRRGGTEGEVVEVLQRARRQFAGTFGLQNNKAVVWLDTVSFSNPVLVGDVRGLPVAADDKVIVELVRFPEGVIPGEGVILEVLGSSKNPAVDTIAVMRQFGLQENFPDEVIQAAREQADKFEEGQIPTDRRDLTKMVTLTIDPYDARDFDDAISLSRNEKGNWELYVHIADVSHFVPIGSPLDEEAKQRATSVYLPDRVIPMLPEIISNHLASLQPDRVRLTKSVLMEMDESGLILHQEVFNSAILNQQRLNYEQVDQYLADAEPWRERLKPEVWQMLRDMHTLAMTLRRNRRADGSIELHLPEIKVDLDKAGKVKGARIVEHTESHQIIEEFMLAANQAVATWLDDLEIPFLRRVHAPPERRKIQKLIEFIRELGIKAENLASRFEIQKVIDLVRSQSTEHAVNYAILKSMSKAIYQPELEVHYALNFKHYCHFTSPIRRYPDLQVHRTINRLLAGQKTPGDPLPVLITLGHHCSDQEQNAEWAERTVTKIKLLHFLAKKIGETMPAVISGVVPDGFYVRGTKFPAEGFVPITSLPQDRYRFERHGHVIEGFRSGNRFRMGDALTVKIEKVDLPRRELLLSVVSNHTAAGDEARFGSSQPAKRAHGGLVAEKGAGRSRKMLRKKSFGNKPKRRKRDR